MAPTRFTLFGGIALLAVQAGAQAAPSAPQAAQRMERQDPLPTRKDGLWEITLRGTTPGPHKPITVQQCTRADAERAMLTALMPGQENCRQIKVHSRGRSADRQHDIQTVCHVHDHRVDGRMQLKGDLQSAYQGQFSTKFANAAHRATSPARFDARWLGDCRPGQRVGDMVLPNGITVNVVDDKQRAEGRQEGGKAQGHAGHSHAPGQAHKH